MRTIEELRQFLYLASLTFLLFQNSLGESLHISNVSSPFLYNDCLDCSYISLIHTNNNVRLNGIKLGFVSRSLSTLNFSIRIFDQGNDLPIPNTTPIYEFKNINVEGIGRIEAYHRFESNLDIKGNRFFVEIFDISDSINLVSDNFNYQSYCNQNEIKFTKQIIHKRGCYFYAHHAFDIEIDFDKLDDRIKLFELMPFDTIFTNDSNSNQSICIEDLNNDGLYDIVYNGRYLENIGQFSFKDKTKKLGLQVGGKLNIVYDIDGNGRKDIVQFSYKDSLSKVVNYIFYNEGDYTQKVEFEAPTLIAPVTYKLLDLNEDSILDIIIFQELRSDTCLKSYLLLSESYNGKDIKFKVEEIELECIDFIDNSKVRPFIIDLTIPNLISDLKVVTGKKIQYYNFVNGNLLKSKSIELLNQNIDPNLDYSISSLLQISDNQHIITYRYPFNERYQDYRYGLYKLSIISENEYLIEPIEEVTQYYIDKIIRGDISNQLNSELIMTKSNMCLDNQYYTENDLDIVKNVTYNYNLNEFMNENGGLLFDINNDGLLDFITVNFDYLSIYKNVLEPVNNYLNVDYSEFENYKFLSCEIYSSDSIISKYLSYPTHNLNQIPSLQHIGVGSNVVDSLIVILEHITNGTTISTKVVQPLLNATNRISNNENVHDAKVVYNPLSIQALINPFLEEAEFVLSGVNRVETPKIEIYNVEGIKVKEIKKQTRQGHQIKFTWNGKDDNGKSVGAGVYFAKVKVNNQLIVERVVKAG